jgi:hypothetical protein
MKRAFLLTITLLTVSTFAMSQADSLQSADVGEPQKHEIMMQGGVSFPYMPGGLRDTLPTGWTGGIGYSISFAPGEIGYTALSLNLDYNSYNHFKKDSKVEAESFTAMVNFKGAFTKWLGPITPYFSIGAGYMYFFSDSFKAGEKLDGGVNHTVAWNFACGIETQICEDLTCYVQGQSVIGSLEEPRQYFPVVAGVRMRLF